MINNNELYIDNKKQNNSFNNSNGVIINMPNILNIEKADKIEEEHTKNFNIKTTNRQNDKINVEALKIFNVIKEFKNEKFIKDSFETSDKNQDEK